MISPGRLYNKQTGKKRKKGLFEQFRRNLEQPLNIYWISFPMEKAEATFLPMSR